MTTPAAPTDTLRAHTRHLHDGDLDRLIALYEPDALFIADGTQEIRGHEALRGFYRQLLSLHPKLELSIAAAHENGDLALVLNDWKLTAQAPDGTVIEREGRSAVVLRRAVDGAWHIALDRP